MKLLKALTAVCLPMSMLFFAAAAVQAGIFKIVTAPIIHPKRTVHAQVSMSSAVHALIAKPVAHVSKDAYRIVKHVVFDTKAVVY